MSHSGSGPGKTSPKLVNDFLHFDPLITGRNSNYLADHTPPVGEGQQLGPQIGSCKHDYITKAKQSFTPPLDLRPDGGAEYKVAVVCKKCRIHADIHINYAYAANPCPNSDFPLHHFRRVKEQDEQEPKRLRYAWSCSAPQCGAQLHITFRLKHLDTNHINLLTDTEQLKRRYEAMVAAEPNREGLRQATPVEPLTRLRRYIKDSLNPQHDKRSFPANNKRFGEAFGVQGQDCRKLLESLGFTHVEERGDMDEMWNLPNPPEVPDRLHADGSSQREMLEDVEFELGALMSTIASQQGMPNPAATEVWSSAERDVERTLSAQGYPRQSSLRRQPVNNEQLPYFASLGLQPDSADSLVAFAYDRQSLCDPEHRAYYLECLQIITESRGTEDLQMKVTMLESQDQVSRRDLTAAYRFLNIDKNEQLTADDERILNIFQSRLPNLGPTTVEESRQALYKIGVSRGSQRLINASKQMLETYEDALAWLGNGASKELPDDSLLAVASIKMDENKELTEKAISIIARERKSNTLNNWLATGSTDGYQMTVDEALRLFSIEESLDKVDATIFPVLFENARNERPGENTEKAIATIQQALAGTTGVSRSPETWPVGLTSHGNTCYLNSILQYYFSIKPFRDIVLNYDKHELDLATHGEKTERVGQRIISKVEIEGGQQFAKDLKHLFERMIKEPSEHVKPEENLVCRAFLDPKDYRLLAPSAHELSAAKVNGAENAVEDKAPETKDPVTPAGPDKHQSDASSVTLQGDDNDTTMQNGDMPPTPPASPGRDFKPQPVGAPPLPPRRFSTTREQALEQAQEKARQQQDVTEVHDAIMFRLRAGMKPKGRDSTGEQEDELRDLFKIGLEETVVKNGMEGKKTPALDTSITTNVPSEATDIYSVLDAVFDLQTVSASEGSHVETYKTLQHLPPLLQVSIPRIGYEASRGAYKSEASVKLEDELYLDRYVDNLHPEVLPKRKACWGWRKQLHALRKEQKALSTTSAELDGPSAIAEAAKYLDRLPSIDDELREMGMDGLDVDSHQLSSILVNDASQQTERIRALETEIGKLEDRLKDQFNEMKALKYRLAAVFFHRGSFGHGHYWIYIHDFEKDIWRSYNDERVEEFTKLEEILKANTWGHGTPTYAVYVKDEQKLDIVQAVCRAPEKPPTPEPTQWPQVEDQKMENGTDQQRQPAYDGNAATVDPNFLSNEGPEVQRGTVEEVSNVSWDTPRTVPGANPW